MLVWHQTSRGRGQRSYSIFTSHWYSSITPDSAFCNAGTSYLQYPKQWVSVTWSFWALEIRQMKIRNELNFNLFSCPRGTLWELCIFLSQTSLVLMSGPELPLLQGTSWPLSHLFPNTPSPKNLYNVLHKLLFLLSWHFHLVLVEVLPEYPRFENRLRDYFIHIGHMFMGHSGLFILHTNPLDTSEMTI